MGSFEDDDDRKHNNSSRINDSDEDSGVFETQQINTQYSDGDLEDAETEDLEFLTNTVPVGDTYLLDDAFETQFMNLAGETQVVDIDEQTQVLDDLDCVRNTPIEFLSKFYTQNAINTEAICETEVLSQEDDSLKIDDMDKTGPKNTEENYPKRQDTFSGGFTSIRCASMRASGLAARQRGSSGNLCPSHSKKSSVEQQTCNKDDEPFQNECIEETKNPKISNKRKIAPSAAVRKLFNDDETDQFDITSLDDNNIDIASEKCLAGLSYVDSQEPNELSQVHALEVVDKFLDLNVMDFEERFGWTCKNVGKKKVDAPGVKGSRELAKKSCIMKNTEGEIGTYDWDDNLEDDGGGDFFVKKKELFFDNRKPKCLTKPKVQAVARNYGGKKEQRWSTARLKGSALPDAGLMLRRTRANANCGKKEEMLRKNLIKDLDRQVNKGTKPNLIENEKTKDFTGKKDATVGPDTQMAAEAMETLCFELQLADSNNSNGPNKAEATGKSQSARKRKCHASVGVVTRRAKQIKRTSNDSPFPAKKSGLIIFETRGTKSTAQRCEEKCHLEDYLDFSVPVANHTRKVMELRRSKEVAKPFDDHITGKSARIIDKKVWSSGPTASDTDAIPRQGSLVQADPKYNTRRLKRSRKDGANDFGTHPGKFRLRQNASNCEKIDSEKSKADGGLEASSPPASCRMPLNNASPICMGDEYHQQSCRKNMSRFSLITEIDNSVAESRGLYCGMTESKKRKDITSVRVLFSQHLNEDVVKQQKKILSKLGGAVATFMSDATHFVANEFVRTRNMLEAIAFGKPVVTQLWLESCGQASCPIDERNYVLRDSKKEKEFGFCLPASLSRACQHPLLQGQKVLVTPNTKPGKVILASLIKAVHGLAIERVGRSVMKHDKLPEDLLILSCEEDYDACVPFLEKGGSIYSSELLLNGIVKQKLEYERHRLFEGHVKRTRSSTWVKKNSIYLPVTKRK